MGIKKVTEPFPIRCTYCFGGDARETKSPLGLCGGCFDSLGAYGRRKLAEGRRIEQETIRGKA